MKSSNSLLAVSHPLLHHWRFSWRNASQGKSATDISILLAFFRVLRAEAGRHDTPLTLFFATQCRVWRLKQV